MSFPLALTTLHDARQSLSSDEEPRDGEEKKDGEEKTEGQEEEELDEIAANWGTIYAMPEALKGQFRGAFDCACPSPPHVSPSHGSILVHELSTFWLLARGFAAIALLCCARGPWTLFCCLFPTHAACMIMRPCALPHKRSNAI
eukprot:720117-Rhodomonas_salina.2